MMDGLTVRQKQVLDFIKDYSFEYGTSPTYNEIMVEIGLRSKSGVHRIISELQERGAIRVKPNCSRSISVVVSKCPHCGGEL